MTIHRIISVTTVIVTTVITFVFLVAIGGSLGYMATHTLIANQAKVETLYPESGLDIATIETFYVDYGPPETIYTRSHSLANEGRVVWQLKELRVEIKALREELHAVQSTLDTWEGKKATPEQSAQAALDALAIRRNWRKVEEP